MLRRKNERLRETIKGADSAKGENRMHEFFFFLIKCEGGQQRITERMKGKKS